MKKSYLHPEWTAVAIKSIDLITASNNSSNDGSNVNPTYIENGGIGDVVPY